MYIIIVYNICSSIAISVFDTHISIYKKNKYIHIIECDILYLTLLF